MIYFLVKKNLTQKTLNSINTSITTIYSVVAVYIPGKLKHY